MASKKANVQVLGLPRTQSDSAHGKIKSEETHQDAVLLALGYAHYFGITNSRLSLRYGLGKNSLTAWSQGRSPERKREEHLRSLKLALNDTRLCQISRGMDATDIDFALGQLALVEAGIATDAELALRQRQCLDVLWAEKSKRKGYKM